MNQAKQFALILTEWVVAATGRAAPEAAEPVRTRLALDLEDGSRLLDHGGLVITWGFESMGWIRNFSAKRL